MKFAIIAAGEGSRLAQEGIKEPKPLVRVGGVRLVDRLLRIFTDCGASEIVVICNNLTPYVSAHLSDIEQHGLDGKKIPLRHIVKTTPSSMHSFYELSSLLGNEPFVMTTVDTIFREEEFRDYIQCFAASLSNGTAEGMMGVTDYIDDEKPLYVRTDAQNRITGFLDADEAHECKYISGGIYGLSASALDTLRRCMESGQSRMRNFQRGLIDDGRQLVAYPFTKVLDIDHASDIEKAEELMGKE